MEYQHFSYSDTVQLPLYVENPLGDTSIDGMIDPILKPSASWTPPQMQRYLTDNNKSSLFSYGMVDSILPETITRREDGVAPLPSSLLQRRDSPSFSHTSSTSSSMLSPPRDSDYYQAHSPPTPTDTTMMFPFFNQYESPSSRAHLYQFTGLADDCVKPIDINPFQETPESYCDDSNPRTEFPSRGYSMSSDDSVVRLDMCSGPGQIELIRPMSPEGLTPDVKDEIHIAEHNGYPAFESEDEMISGEEAEVPNLKQEDAEDDEYKPKQKLKRTKSSANRHTRTRKRHNSLGSSPEAKRLKVEPSDSIAMNGSTAKPVLQGAKGSFSCTECSKKVSFKDENGLQNHIKKQHTRPFVCVFGFAGCNSTFASKNEWKRHCSSQHLVLNYWVCQQDQCSKVSSKAAVPARNRSKAPFSQNACMPALPRGTIFNRKDLYTQHLRRMHIPANLKKQVKQRKPAPEWEARERAHQDEAKRTRCDLPTHMLCPAKGCNARFDGVNAWDDRMEHVAKHLEKAVAGLEAPIDFGGEHDRTLTEWATRAEIAIIEKGGRGKWKLRNPLKSNSNLMVETIVDQEGEEDAEGEEVDE
ncbi:hypothetical protein F4819DRAFT_456037 [Hypoxylon fuscum]|nr:hypothetical protein F4819DRAFT_456037 [Hypoxylon fuscum]